jgi:ABC-type multidrug transport system ATPase subunit/ABC-type multidrug transport system permease subunit
MEPPRTGWLLVGSSPSADVVVDGAGLSEQHARVRTVDGDPALDVEDLGTFHGTFVDGVRVTSARVHDGSRVDLAGATFRVQHGRLVRVQHARRGARLDLHRLRRALPDGTALFDDVTASVLPGELVAVIGASGAGKTSLVRTIVGAEPPDDGVVLVDGEDLYLHLARIGSLIGYLPQQPSLHGRLTVRAAVGYAAQLRLPPDADHDTEVQVALERARIAHRADARIEQLSGGETKRAHLAAELVGDPGILILDEPTSGLDALLDRELMDLFRAIANEGTGVVVVTHALEHLDQCDRLLVLGRGGLVASDRSPDATRTWFAAPDLTSTLAVVEHDPAQAAARHREQRGSVPDPARSRRFREPDGGNVNGWWSQVAVLTRRSWELLARDRRTLLSLLLQAPVIGLALLAVTEAGTFSDPEVPATITEVEVFGIAITVVWLASLAAAREVTKEATVLARERLLGVRPGAYLASKALTLVPIAAWQSAIVLLLVTIVAGLPPAGAMLPGVLEAWLTLLVAVAAATGLGLLVSALAPNEDRAIALVPYVLLPQFLLAGVAFDVPEWLEPVQFLTIAYWSISGLGGTVNVCAHPFGGASTCARALGMPFGHGVADIVSRWLVLGALALAAWGIAWLVLARRDAARRYR